MVKLCYCKMGKILQLNIVLLTVVAISLCTTIVVILVLNPSKNNPGGSIACNRIKGSSLPNVLDVNPLKDKSIFFLETSCSSYKNGNIQITARKGCAVESAALMNPNLNVYLLVALPGFIRYNDSTLSSRLSKALLTYKNVKILHLDYAEYSKDTPVEILFKSGKLESSLYPYIHASDVLRLLTLWKYGGIYLDLDVVVIKSLENLSQNYVGAESDFHVANGILNFAATGKGHHLAELCLKDLNKNFRGDEWSYNGPGVITRSLKRMCGIENVQDMMNKDCQGFTVFPPETFYPVPWWKWTMYFDRQYNDKLLDISKNSYAIHVWSKLSKTTKINVKSDVLYSIFAKRHCPKVFAECDEYF